jgi:hypothetical protein
MIEYEEFVPYCADLIKAFKSHTSALIQEERREEWAEMKATEMSDSFYSEVKMIIDYLQSRIGYIYVYIYIYIYIYIYSIYVFSVVYR